MGTPVSGFRLTVLRYILDHPGSTGRDVALAIGPQDSLYGQHHAISGAVAQLRAAGYLQDCPRCPTCGCAQSRALRNVPLVPTQKALNMVRGVWDAPVGDMPAGEVCANA
jgi:hypothetical protein